MLMPIFSTDKDPFINRCVALSENVDNYINNKLYLADVEDIKLADQLYLTTQCLDIILGELADRGIVFENTASEFMELLYDREIPLQLRQRFEPNTFFEMIKKFSDESRNLLMNEFEYADEQLGARLCGVMSHIVPTDAAWSYIEAHAHMFTTNEVFRDTMRAVVEKAIYEPPAPMPVENDLTRIANWMKGEQQHQEELKNLLVTVAETTYNQAGDNESSTALKLELMKKMERYDWDHRLPAFVAKMMTNPKAEEEDEFNHQQKNDHHIQYYLQHNSMDVVQEYMVACTAASKDKGEQLRKDLENELLQITSDNKQHILAILKVAEECWIKMHQEVMNGAR